MPWFCWMILGALCNYIVMVVLSVLIRFNQKQKDEEEDNDMILYTDVYFFIFAQKGDQIQIIWDISQYEEKNIIAVQVTYDEQVINMLPEEMREGFRSDGECSCAVLPQATIWRQGDTFGWFME